MIPYAGKDSEETILNREEYRKQRRRKRIQAHAQRGKQLTEALERIAHLEAENARLSADYNLLVESVIHFGGKIPKEWNPPRDLKLSERQHILLRVFYLRSEVDHKTVLQHVYGADAEKHPIREARRLVSDLRKKLEPF